MGPIKSLLINILTIGISLGIGLVFVEISLRVLPSSLTGISSEIPLVSDPDIAFIRKGNQSALNESSCFSARVSTNSIGFRDSEWNEDQPVVVLGDSYMEAVQVGDTQHFSAQLESLLDVPVANLGRSSFGTIAELATFEKFAVPLNPKLVILALFTPNDIEDNNCNQSRGPNGTITKPCGEIEDGVISFPKNFYSTSGSHALRSFVREQCSACALVKNFLARKQATQTEEGVVSRESAALYLPQGTAGESIEDSWLLTEEALKQLKASVEAAEAQLVIVSIPSFFSYSYDPREYFSDRYGGAEIPEDFNSLEPVNRAQNLARDLDIPFIRLEESFVAYRDEHNLQYPFFSYSCDGHWNPLGHAIAAAHTVQLFASSTENIHIRISEDALKDAESILNNTPEDILGAEGVQRIYSGGVYRTE